MAKCSLQARLSPQRYFIRTWLPLRTSNNIQLWAGADSETLLVLRALPVPTSCREMREASGDLVSKAPSGKYPTGFDDSVLPATDPGLNKLTHGERHARMAGSHS